MEDLGAFFLAALLAGALIFNLVTGNDDSPDLSPGGGAPMDGEVWQP